MKQLSIIIVTYNSEKDIYECIKSIRNYSDIPLKNIELIVVDNNSKAPLPMFSKIKEIWGEQVITIQNKENKGYGQGNNIGINASSAHIILIMNPDVRLYEPIFQTAINAFEGNPNLGLYGMKQMLTPAKSSSNSFSCTYMMNGYLATIITAICIRLDRYIQKIMHISGACFFLDKKMFEKAGMFDETNFLYCEEDDIHYRLRKTIPKIEMIYNKNLHYLHLTNDREPNLEYEKKIIIAAVKQNEKNGYPTIKTLKNRLANTNVQIIREKIRHSIGKGNSIKYSLLKNLKEYILDEILSNKKE